MASPNVLPQTGGAPQPAPSTQPTELHPWRPASWEGSHRYLTLYFSEVNGDIHGPMYFAPDERVEQIQQWLEEETFRSRCVDEETNEWLAHAEISTSCGMVLDLCRNLYDYPVSDGDTLR